MRRISITKRLTIWYTIFMLLITGCFMGVLIYIGNVRASEAAKAVLMDSVADASEEVEGYGEDFVVDDKLSFYEDGVYISIYDGDGDLVEGRRPGELSHMLPELKDKEVIKLQDEAGEIWYVYDSMFQVNGQSVWVRGMVKDFAEQSTFSFVLKLAAIAFPVLVIIAALGGYIITRRAFRPVRDIIRTVEDIREDGDLSRRVASEHGEMSGKGEAVDEISALAVTFNSLFDRLEAVFRKEKQFTSDVSHELRTPLAVIISQSDYALEDEEYRVRALEKINDEARRMSSLVNELLTLSRSDAGRLIFEKHKVSLDQVCHMVAEQQAAVASEKALSIETEIEDGIDIIGDESMLIRILLNLMDNAVKYSGNGKRVALSLFREGNFAVCSVEDDGIGISAEELDRIWERFYRADESRSEEGSGLGLAMVAALVKAHGGRTEVTSTPGEGSCFKVYFPIPDIKTEDQ